jgi:hypothetical protein
MSVYSNRESIFSGIRRKDRLIHKLSVKKSAFGTRKDLGKTMMGF